MSVKVVSPTDPGQPELPMSLRPQPAPSGGRSRQCLSPAAEPRHRPSAADSRQPQLPIPLCTSSSAAVDPGQPELPLPAIPEQVRAGEAGLPAVAGGPALPVVGDAGPAVAGGLVLPAVGEAGQLELPAPEQSRGPAADGSGRPELPAPGAAGVGVGRLELPAPKAADAGSGRPEPAASTDPRPPVVPPSAANADPGSADLPIPEAPAGAGESSELPMALRPPRVDADQSQLPMSLRPPASPAAAGLLAQARRELAEAVQESRPAERFIGAYLAALRGAAAVLAARGRPHRGRARPASTWVLLDSVAPELREWSAFFASNSATRAAAQAGITGKVTAESAAGLVGAATPFLELVRRLVHGLPITGEAHVA